MAGARKSALKDIKESTTKNITYNNLGYPEVWGVTVDHIINRSKYFSNTDKLRFA